MRTLRVGGGREQVKREWDGGKLGWAVSELGRDVSIREFPAQISRDTRTRRGYVSWPYPGRIRVGYVSDTGYARNLLCPCF